MNNEYTIKTSEYLMRMVSQNGVILYREKKDKI